MFSTKKSTIDGAKTGIQCGTRFQSSMGQKVHSDSSGPTAKPPKEVGLRKAWWWAWKAQRYLVCSSLHTHARPHAHPHTHTAHGSLE